MDSLLLTEARSCSLGSSGRTRALGLLEFPLIFNVLGFITTSKIGFFLPSKPNLVLVRGMEGKKTPHSIIQIHFLSIKVFVPLISES